MSSLAQAWAAYDRGDVSSARALADALVRDEREACAAHAALGYFLLKAGDAAGARACLTTAIGRWPGHAPAHWYLGLVHQEAGQLEAAAAALRRALEIDPALDEAAFALGWILHDLGRLEEAARWSQLAFATRSDAARALQLGWLQQRQGDAPAAAVSYRLGLRSVRPGAPEAVRLHVHLAQCLAEAGDPEAAWEAIAAGLAAHPDDPHLLTERAWALRRRGERGGARAIARTLVERDAGNAAVWTLLGLLEKECGDLRAADAALARAIEAKPDHVEALLLRARLQREWSRFADARWLVDLALYHRPHDDAARDLRAQLLLDARETRDARAWLVPQLRRGVPTPDRWRLLASAHEQRGRPGAALRALRRALRLDPGDIEALRAVGWLTLGMGALEAALDAVRRLLQRVSDAAAWVQAAFIFAEVDQLAEAERWAEQAAAQAPGDAHAWRALAHVRQRQRRLPEAESAILQALRLAPENLDCLRQLGWVLLGARRVGEAQLAFRRTLLVARDRPLARIELAQALQAGDELPAALDLVDAALAERPGWAPASLLRAWLLAAGAAGPDGRGEAVEVATRLLRRREGIDAAAAVLFALAGDGVEGAFASVRLLPPAQRARLARRAIEEAFHTRGQQHLARLTAWARTEFEEDLWFEGAALYAASFDPASTAGELALRAREWARGLKIRAGLSRSIGERPDRGVRRPRIAYVAGQLHQPLLRRVLAAHDPTRVDVFLFSCGPDMDLPGHVRRLPLHPPALAQSCAANGIDLVIDAGGLHPLEGQFEVLQAYAQRVAPRQAGWLGCWGTAGGLFDLLLTDEAGVPPAHEARIEERVVRLEGGAWCWDPPGFAPPVSPLPAARRGTVVFGVVARSLRLQPAPIDAFAQVLARSPDAGLRFIGPLAADASLRAQVIGRCEAAGIAAHRIAFDAPRPHGDYLAWLAEVDIVLDTFPGGGGLSLLDPLWMGVPVVTLAGEWPGARQAASLLAAIGWTDGVTACLDDFVARAVALGSDRGALARLRGGLRQRMAASPLLDGRRLAAQVEALAEEGEPAGLAPRPATATRKAAVRLHADALLRAWLEAPRTIDLPTPGDATPDLSVVVVLYNQAGLTRKTLQALADQRGVRFETLIVDNASSDATPQLLARVHGARILRNDDNLGFLLAANQGAAVARGRHLVFLNSDAILQRDALRCAREAIEADPTIGALGGRIVLTDGGLQEAGNVTFRDGSAGGIGRGQDPFGPAARAARSTDYVSGVLLVTPRRVWERLGGFDPTFAPAYFEDTDYCRRVWLAGLRVVYEPSVLVEHLEWGSATGEGVPPGLVQNQAIFRERHADWLAGQPLPTELPLDGDRWRSPEDAARRRPRVLLLDNEVPHADKGGGLPRARFMVQALAGVPLTFYPLWSLEDDWGAVRRSVPSTVEVVLGLGLAGLEAFLERRRGVYDVLVVSRPPNLQAIQPLRQRRPDLFAGLRLVYDAEALFALRDVGKAAVQGRPWASARARAHVAGEVALARGADEVLVVSERDASHFRAAGLRTRILPHATPLVRNVPGPGARAGLLFVGALVPDTPNEDGLLWFCREVLPRLAGHGAPRLTIVGRCHSERIASLAGPQVHLAGAQDDLQPHYDAARVFVAPARYAGGIPMKVIEAAAAGLPVAASALLVRQLGWGDGVAIRGARDAAAFARAIAALLTDDEAWMRQQAAAWRECERRYDPAAFRAALLDAVGARAMPQAK